MNATESKFRLRGGGRSQCARIRAYLEARRGQWVPMTDLWRASGAFAVHSRIADLRKLGLSIDHADQPSPDGPRLSFYRLNP